MSEKSIVHIANEISKYKNSCPRVDVDNITKTLLNLDNTLQRCSNNRASSLQRSEPKAD